MSVVFAALIGVWLENGDLCCGTLRVAHGKDFFGLFCTAFVLHKVTRSSAAPQHDVCSTSFACHGFINRTRQHYEPYRTCSVSSYFLYSTAVEIFNKSFMITLEMCHIHIFLCDCTLHCYFSNFAMYLHSSQ